MKTTSPVTVSLSDLISFKKNASSIKTNSIIPALSFIKFEEGTITKNNLREFIIQKIPVHGKFLVEERVLFNFIDYATGDVDFIINENKITLSDGSTKVVSQLGDAETFAASEQPGENKTDIPSDVLNSMSIAAKFTQEDEFHPVKPYVFIGAQSIAASDGMIAYYKKFDVELPEFVLSRTNAEKIGALSGTKYSSNGNYNFFESGNIIYGFVKPESRFTNMGVYFDYEKNLSFVIDKRDLIKFNDTCTSISPSKMVYPIFKINGDKLLLSMIDADYNLDINREIQCSGSMNGSFKYIGSLMSRLLKTVPDDVLTFYQSDNMYYITGESGFNSLIMQII